MEAAQIIAMLVVAGFFAFLGYRVGYSKGVKKFRPPNKGGGTGGGGDRPAPNLD
jgi:hypothetical protein